MSRRQRHADETARLAFDYDCLGNVVLTLTLPSICVWRRLMFQLDWSSLAFLPWLNAEFIL